MKKKIKWIPFLLSAMFILQGCLLDTYPLTDDERNKIAEYAACVLLRNDKYFNYTSIITPTPMPTPTDMPMPTAEPDASPTPTVKVDEPQGGTGVQTESDNKNENIKKNVSLTEVFGLAELEFEYSDYQICDQYKGLESIGDYVVMAGQGKQLVVVEFTVKNTAGIAQEVNFATLGVNYQLDAGETAFAQPQITLFTEDMQYMNESISAGDIKKGIIVFQIKKDADLSGANIIVSREDVSSILKLN